MVERRVSKSQLDNEGTYIRGKADGNPLSVLPQGIREASRGEKHLSCKRTYDKSIQNEQGKGVSDKREKLRPKHGDHKQVSISGIYIAVEG